MRCQLFPSGYIRYRCSGVKTSFKSDAGTGAGERGRDGILDACFCRENISGGCLIAACSPGLDENFRLGGLRIG